MAGACLLALAGAAPAATLRGTVLFKGTPPKAKVIKMGQDDYCVKYYRGKPTQRSEAITVNGNHSLRWVFVYIQKGAKKKFKAPSQAALLDQQGCLYTPRVLGMMAGQKLTVKNGDRTKHNFHLLGKNRYNRSAGPGKTISRKIKKAARLKLKKGKSRVMSKIKCDIHPWMVAYVGVMPNPFFSVTGKTGEFEIKGLPAGDYVLAAWHEKLGTLTQKVTVGAKDIELNFAFSGKK